MKRRVFGKNNLAGGNADFVPVTKSGFFVTLYFLCDELWH